MNSRTKPQVLCVDDESRVVEGLALVLRKEYDVHVASSAEEALQMLRTMTDLAVVISDMRMPKVDGASFLHEMLLRRPDAARIMLTGQANRDEAIRAVNEGQIFRFLAKPCPVDQLKAAIEAGVVQYRLANAERSVLKETLLGCIKALMEVLAVANPVAFGRAAQIKRRATELARRFGSTEFWQLEAAAMLSQVGYVALPATLVEKLHFGERLTPAEQAQIAGVPDMANKLLEHIPRLEPVIQILAALKYDDAQIAKLGEGTIGLGARILGLVLEYDTLLAQGKSHDSVCEHLCGRVGRYGVKLIGQLDACIVSQREGEQTVELPLRQVLPGMTLCEEIRTSSGALLVPKGFEVTKSFLERIANLAPDLLMKPIRVVLADTRPPARAH
jgi:response regulator RpfG family c-di-GMP phosphodiesterase